MTRELAYNSIIADLKHLVTFESLSHPELKELIECGALSFGQAINECDNTECLCKISKLYPEIMVLDRSYTIYVCPFCYSEGATNDIWGYSVHTTAGNMVFYRYDLMVHFKNLEDACLFYTENVGKYSDIIKLQIVE